jgi:hypothetical protein
MGLSAEDEMLAKGDSWKEGFQLATANRDRSSTMPTLAFRPWPIEGG